MNQQFYMITLPEAISHYQQGDLTAKGLLHLYFKIKIAPGWTKTISQKEICEELGIKKTAFYNALSRLKAEGSIVWSVPDNTKFSITLPVRETGNDSAIAENQNANAESQFTIAENQNANAESQFTIAENKTPKPAPAKAYSDSPYYSSNSYQTLLKSLSDQERENFLNFCQEEAKKLPKPPILPGKWIEANAIHLKAKWDNFCGKSDDSSNQQSKFGPWTSHPRLNEMWENIIKYGVMEYCVNNISDVTIRDFCQFVINSNELVQELDNVEITNV